MKRIYTFLYIILWIPLYLFAQKDSTAEEILKETERFLQSNEGIRAEFETGEHGLLLMKGEQFYLNCAGIQTWYNGKTQWSYVEANEEVNISTPTKEELQHVNPYLLMKSYKQGYNYKFIGNRTINGKRGYEIILTPQKTQDISSITLFISIEYMPLYIKIVQENQSAIEFKVTTCQHSQHLSDEMFTFDKNKFPDAEIIDLR